MNDKPSKENGKVESDLLYSTEHVWIKKLAGDMALIGMTDRFQLTTGLVYICWLSPPETVLKAGESFGSMEAAKMAVDLISPVSGRVIETNQSLMSAPGPINTDPYNGGWMLKIKMNQPDELAKLMSPEDYAHLPSADCGDIPGISAEGLLRLIERREK